MHLSSLGTGGILCFFVPNPWPLDYLKYKALNAVLFFGTFADCTSEKNRDDFSVSSYASSNELLTPADVWGYWMQNGSNFVLFLEGKAIIIQIQLCQ